MDKENERYHMLQETGKLPPRRLDSGKPKLTDTQRKNKKNAKQIKRSQKGAIGANNLFFQQEERDIYNYVWARYKEYIIKTKGELNIADEDLLKYYCIVQIRLFRKVRLESNFNKFFDRLVTQDPMAQGISILKALGLITDKAKESSGNKELLSKLLTEESEEAESVKPQTLEEWQQSQDEDDEIKLQLFTPKDASMFNTDFADDEDNEDDQRVDTLPF